MGPMIESVLFYEAIRRQKKRIVKVLIVKSNQPLEPIKQSLTAGRHLTQSTN